MSYNDLFDEIEKEFDKIKLEEDNIFDKPESKERGEILKQNDIIEKKTKRRCSPRQLENLKKARQKRLTNLNKNKPKKNVKKKNNIPEGLNLTEIAKHAMTLKHNEQMFKKYKLKAKSRYVDNKKKPILKKSKLSTSRVASDLVKKKDPIVSKPPVKQERLSKTYNAKQRSLFGTLFD